MRRGSHPGESAEALHRVGDTSIVCRHDHRVDSSRVRGTPVDVLDHRTAGDLCEWFSRESSRVVAGRNDCDRRDVCCSFEGITERDRVHGES
jgi:hypothetical protein